MTRKRIQYTPDDPDKYTLEEMTEKKEEICERATDQGRLQQLASLMKMEKKSVIIIGIMSSTVGLFLLATAVAVPQVSASNNNCVDLDCIKERVIRCILEAAGEYEFRECIKEYLPNNSSLSCPQGPAYDLLYRDWCVPAPPQVRP